MDKEIIERWLEDAKTSALEGGTDYGEWLDYWSTTPDEGAPEHFALVTEFQTLLAELGQGGFDDVFAAKYNDWREQMFTENEAEVAALVAERKAAEKSEKAPAKSQPSTRRSRRAKRAAHPKRAMWAYAPVPRAILRDTTLSLAEKVVAATIADALNPGRWNGDLHVNLSQRELAKRIGSSQSVVGPAVAELRKRGILDVTLMKGRGGTVFKFRMEALQLTPTHSAPADGSLQHETPEPSDVV